MTRHPTSVLTRTRHALRALAAAGALTALLAGIPYALLHFARPWQPTRVPGWDGISAWLQSPYDTVVLLQLLTCVCWLLWLWLLGQTIAEVAWYVTHAAELLGPVTGGTAALNARRTLSGILIATVVLGLAAALRTTTGVPTVRLTAETATWTAPTTATAPALPGSSAAWEAATSQCTVKPGDTLWDLAARHLGDPQRWPEIFTLNAHQPQHDGRSLKDPDLIYPGWTLRLPDEQTSRAPATSPAPAPSTMQLSPPPTPESAPAPQPSTTPEPAAAPAHPHPSATPHPHGTAPRHAPGIDLTGAGGYIPVSLAAILSATALTVMRRRRRSYHPDDLTKPQDARTEHPEESGLLQAIHRTSALHPGTPPPAAGNPIHLPMASDTTGEVTLPDLLNAGPTAAITLTGDGSLPAARALLVTALATPDSPHRLIINRDDLTELLGTATIPTGPALQVTNDHHANIDALEEELLRRARLDHEEKPGTPNSGLVILLARTNARPSPRLSALLAASRHRGLAAVLLEPDPATAPRHHLGAVYRVAADGQAARLQDDGTLTSPLRMFHLATGSTTTLCTLLAHAQEFSTLPLAKESETDETGEGHSFLAEEVSDPIPDFDRATKSAEEQSPQLDGTSFRAATRAPTPLSDGQAPSLVLEADPADAPPMPPQASTVPTDMPVSRRAVTIQVLGPLQILARDAAVTKGMAGSAGELLAYLAVHPGGATKDAIEEALWPERTAAKRTEAFNTAKNTVRKALREALGCGTTPKFIIAGSNLWRLDPQLISTDITDFQAAVRRCSSAPDGLQACRTVADLYAGPLCQGADFHWLTALNEETRRRVLSALSTLATAAGNDTERAIQLLSEAIGHDAYGEELHLRLARLHAQRGEPDAVRRVFDQLIANLRTIGEKPTAATASEFHTLLRPTAPKPHRPGAPVTRPRA